MNRLGLQFLLLIAVFFSAVGVVVTRYETRSLFIEFRALERQHDALMEEWERIQIEKGTWSTSDRIESIAQAELNMVSPGQGRIIWITQ